MSGQVTWNNFYPKAYLRLSLLGVNNLNKLTDRTKVLPNKQSIFVVKNQFPALAAPQSLLLHPTPPAQFTALKPHKHKGWSQTYHDFHVPDLNDYLPYLRNTSQTYYYLFDFLHHQHGHGNKDTYLYRERNDKVLNV